MLTKNNFKHAFFTKRIKNNSPKNLQNEINLSSNIHFLNQIHSNEVLQVSDELNTDPKTGDCMITQKNGQSLWVYTADCIPILIADTNTRIIAACHTGLKGLKKQKVLSIP